MSKFEINEETREVKGNSKWINISKDTAIANDRYFDSLEVKEGEFGKYVEIIVKNKEEQECKTWINEPKLGAWIKSEADLEKEISKHIALYANIVRRYCGQKYKVDGDSYMEVVQQIISDIKASDKFKNKSPMWIKLVRDKKGFVKLPSYAPVCADINLTKEELADKKINLVINSFDTVDYVPTVPDKEDESFPPEGNATKLDF